MVGRQEFSPEFRVEVVRLVIDRSRPIVEVAREIGVNEGTLGKLGLPVSGGIILWRMSR